MRGVPPNALNMSPIQIMKNDVFNDLITILGLKFGSEFDIKNLNFGKIVISPDYITKHSIALKEANETKFWLTLLLEEQSLSQKEYNSLMNDLIQIIKILTTLVKTAKGL